MKTKNREESERQDAFGIGTPNDAYARYFTGHSYLKPLTEPGEAASDGEPAPVMAAQSI